VINDLLDLTQVEDSGMLMHEEPYSLREVLLEVVGAYAAEAERKGLAISFKIDPVFVADQVIGDPQRLRQAVSNILSNSLAHSNRGTITVEIFLVKADTASTEDTVSITVRDEGNGMSEQQLDSLFLQLEDILDEEEDPGNDGDSKPSVPTVSIGLGLSVVARFVRNSNGQMKIETVAGRGTRVSLLLPLKTASGSQAHSALLTPPTDFTSQASTATSFTINEGNSRFSETVDVNPPSASSVPSKWGPLSATTAGSTTSERDSFPFPPTDHIFLRVLVAEDNPLNAKVIKMQLTKMGHEVTIVGDGQACLDKFKSDPAYFDMILMDFQVFIAPFSAFFSQIINFLIDAAC
jgi:CheY-like chemotaxis protein